MPIVKTFDFSDFVEEFRDFVRIDNFSRQGLEFIFNYLSDCYYDTNWEMDCIAICCEFNESSCPDLLQDYDIVYDDDMNNEELADQVRDYLNDNTSIVGEYQNDIGETVFVYVAF